MSDNGSKALDVLKAMHLQCTYPKHCKVCVLLYPEVLTKKNDSIVGAVVFCVRSYHQDVSFVPNT